MPNKKKDRTIRKIEEALGELGMTVLNYESMRRGFHKASILLEEVLKDLKGEVLEQTKKRKV